MPPTSNDASDFSAVKNALGEIVSARREDVAALRAELNVEELRSRCQELPAVRPFCQSLRNVAGATGQSIIAEFKRRSPGAGEIRSSADPVATARAYELYGAACLSVLTEFRHFGGTLADLQRVREATTLPVLRKDFLIDPLQMYESRAAGVDCVLLIAEAVTPGELQDLYGLALELGLEVLVELFEEDSISAIHSLDPVPRLLGVNNRNLKTLDMHPRRVQQLMNQLPAESWLVGESGFSTREEIVEAVEAGISSFLIGTSLMRGTEPGRNLRELTGNPLKAE